MNKNIQKFHRAIVTGAAGFIGSAIVERLCNQGVEVIAVDKNPVSREDCKCIVLDISKPNTLDKYLSQDTVIFHMASKASVPGSVEDPVRDFNNTFYGLFQVLESAKKYDCRVIFPSTASIFDVNNSLPVTEKSYVKPSSPYGAAKISGESYCFAYYRCYGLDVRIARMFSVYGIGMNRFAIHDIVRKIQNNNKEITILGDGKQIRDYLYIDDVVDGLIKIATNGKPGEDYNLASGQGVMLLDLAKNIASIMGFQNIKISLTGESFPGDIPKWYGDITKINNIGFNQKIFLKNGLIKTIKWLESQEK
jgi:UDP-glucose 4-epimerase